MTGIVDTDKMQGDQAYEARGIVARIEVIGHYQHGPFLNAPLYRFLTIDPGSGRDKFAVEYVRPARIDEEGYLEMETLRKGDIVVNPGFIYKKIPWTDPLLAEHFSALRTYRPKVIVKSDVDRDAPVIDLGAVADQSSPGAMAALADDAKKKQ